MGGAPRSRGQPGGSCYVVSWPNNALNMTIRQIVNVIIPDQAAVDRRGGCYFQVTGCEQLRSNVKFW